MDGKMNQQVMWLACHQCGTHMSFKPNKHFSPILFFLSYLQFLQFVFSKLGFILLLCPHPKAPQLQFRQQFIQLLDLRSHCNDSFFTESNRETTSTADDDSALHSQSLLANERASFQSPDLRDRKTNVIHSSGCSGTNESPMIMR